jgi:AcrR family transcriptional regulator
MSVGSSGVYGVNVFRSIRLHRKLVKSHSHAWKDPMTDTAVATTSRAPLTRDRVLQAAVELADRGGLDELSMRKLGQELGVEGMALYRHVRNKEDILDGIVDVVMREVEAPETPLDWKSGLRQLSHAARRVMLRHPWAPAVIVSRPDVGPATLSHIDAVLRNLDAGGFSIDMAHHALHVLGSRVFGFTQDPFNDANDVRPDPATAAAIAQALAVSYPSVGKLAAAATHDGGLGGCDDDFEFAFGLGLILDGLDRHRAGV